MCCRQPQQISFYFSNKVKFNVFLTLHHELTIQCINYQPDALIIICS